MPGVFLQSDNDSTEIKSTQRTWKGMVMQACMTLDKNRLKDIHF